MNRRSIVRGIQIIVLITLATFAWITFDEIREQRSGLAEGLSHLHPGWLVVAAICALQEGVCGGLRIFVLGRVLSKELKVRTAIISEFVLMFCAGVTPGQAGAAPSQVAVLANGGMRLVDVATAELLTASCTIFFFLATAILVAVMRATGALHVESAQIDYLLGLSVAVFGTGLLTLILCAAYPPLLKGVIRVLARPFGALWRATLRTLGSSRRLRAWSEKQLANPGAIRKRLVLSVDDFHAGFLVYFRRGKAAYGTALLLTFGFFISRFAVAYFILLGLGVSTTPDRFVAAGPPILQVILVQALLNFALYLSPTPGASGIAELASNKLMAPWIRGPFELPYLVLWRLLALFLCMFVGGIYVFRYLGTDVLEKQVKAAEDAKRALDEEKIAESERLVGG